mgnify:CR=1 FL=1
MWEIVDYMLDFEKAWENLTQRQKDCLRLSIEGWTQKEIAALLGISQSTVRDHIEAGRKKLPQYHLKS